MSFEFTAFRAPFPEWHGPYSPARGNGSGFRVRGGSLMTIVDTDDGREDWVVQRSQGVASLLHLVRSHWGGGRVLMLPNGLVVKPSPDGDGSRWVIGQFRGPVILEGPDGTEFNLADPGPLSPGSLWPGPKTTGIECVIDARTGSLRANARTPTETGFLETAYDVLPRSLDLARGYAIAQPGRTSGRVRVTANGHVITNRERLGRWECVYVGKIDVSVWAHIAEWAKGVIVDTADRIVFDACIDMIDSTEAFDVEADAIEVAYGMDAGNIDDDHDDEDEDEYTDLDDESGGACDDDAWPPTREEPPGRFAASAAVTSGLTSGPPPAAAPPHPSPSTSAIASTSMPKHEPRRGLWAWLASLVKGN